MLLWRQMEHYAWPPLTHIWWIYTIWLPINNPVILCLCSVLALGLTWQRCQIDGLTGSHKTTKIHGQFLFLCVFSHPPTKFRGESGFSVEIRERGELSFHAGDVPSESFDSQIKHFHICWLFLPYLWNSSAVPNLIHKYSSFRGCRVCFHTSLCLWTIFWGFRLDTNPRTLEF